MALSLALVVPHSVWEIDVEEARGTEGLRVAEWHRSTYGPDPMMWPLMIWKPGRGERPRRRKRHQNHRMNPEKRRGASSSRGEVVGEVWLSEERREDRGCSWQPTATVSLCPKLSSLAGATRTRCLTVFAPSERILGRRRDRCSRTAESNVVQIPPPWSRQGRMTATATERSYHWTRPCAAGPAARSRIHAVHAAHAAPASRDIEWGISESLLFLCDADVPCAKQCMLAHVVCDKHSQFPVRDSRHGPPLWFPSTCRSISNKAMVHDVENLRHFFDIRSGGAGEGIHRAYARCPSREGRCGESF